MMPNNMMMNLLLGRLRQQNPQGYTQIQQWMQSGKDPQTIINELLQSGQISQQDVSKAKAMFSQIQNTNQNNNYRRF